MHGGGREWSQKYNRLSIGSGSELGLYLPARTRIAGDSGMPVISKEVVEGMARFTLTVLLLCERPPAASDSEPSSALIDILAGRSSPSPRPMLWMRRYLCVW